MSRMVIETKKAACGKSINEIVQGEVFHLRGTPHSLYLRTNDGGVNLDSFVRYSSDKFALNDYVVVSSKLIVG